MNKKNSNFNWTILWNRIIQLENGYRLNQGTHNMRKPQKKKNWNDSCVKYVPEIEQSRQFVALKDSDKNSVQVKPICKNAWITANNRRNFRLSSQKNRSVVQEIPFLNSDDDSLCLGDEKPQCEKSQKLTTYAFEAALPWSISENERRPPTGSTWVNLDKEPWTML